MAVTPRASLGASAWSSRTAVRRIGFLRLSGQSAATSGDYRNFRLLGGRRLSHTIDPRVGEPVSHALASVTVVAASAVEADGLATAIQVLGPDEGWHFACREGLAALLLVRSESGFERRAILNP